MVSNVFEEDDTSASFQGRYQTAYYLSGFLVRPVVQNHLEDVDVGRHGLGLEEVVWCEGDAGFEFSGEVGFEDGLDLGQILDGDGELGEVFG